MLCTAVVHPDSAVCEGDNLRPHYLAKESVHIKSHFLWLQVHHNRKTTEDEWLCIHFLKGENVHRIFNRSIHRNKGQHKEATTGSCNDVDYSHAVQAHGFYSWSNQPVVVVTLRFNLERQNSTSSRRNSLSINRLKSLSGNLCGSAILQLAFKTKYVLCIRWKVQQNISFTL